MPGLYAGAGGPAFRACKCLILKRLAARVQSHDRPSTGMDAARFTAPAPSLIRNGREQAADAFAP